MLSYEVTRAVSFEHTHEPTRPESKCRRVQDLGVGLDVSEVS